MWMALLIIWPHSLFISSTTTSAYALVHQFMGSYWSQPCISHCGVQVTDGDMESCSFPFPNLSASILPLPWVSKNRFFLSPVQTNLSICVLYLIPSCLFQDFAPMVAFSSFLWSPSSNTIYSLKCLSFKKKIRKKKMNNIINPKISI